MDLNTRKVAFEKLSKVLKDVPDEIVEKACEVNSWFTPYFVKRSLCELSLMLNPEKIDDFCNSYPIEMPSNKRLGVIMAGNIPAVGFHDLFTVLLSGAYLFVKFSSKDKELMGWIVQQLIKIEPKFNERIHVLDKLRYDELDALIFTGSNNSALQMEYSCPDLKKIVRRNMSSVAILDGTESISQLKLLAEDLFLYYGLGCRNISKLFVPKSYDFSTLVDVFKEFDFLLNNISYKNNYLKNKAIFNIDKVPHLDGEFFLLTQSDKLNSPLSVINYSFYETSEELDGFLRNNFSIQCVVGKNFLPFGTSQRPSLKDFADGVDVVEFILSL
jgi:hypothetical protein